MIFFLPHQVYNVIPSISAITGVTPQTYMWRIAVAFHVGPRMVIAQVYYNYFINQMAKVVDKSTSYILINLCYWLNLIEIAAICGVTYISNRENYRAYPSLLSCWINNPLYFNHPYVLSFSRAREDLHFVHAQLVAVHDRHDQDIQHGAHNHDGTSASVIYHQENTIRCLYHVDVYVDNLLYQTSILLPRLG